MLGFIGRGRGLMSTYYARRDEGQGRAESFNNPSPELIRSRARLARKADHATES